MNNLLFFASDFKIGLSSLLTDELMALYNSNINIIAVAGENEQEKGLSEKLTEKKIFIHKIAGLDEHKQFKQLANSLYKLILSNDIRFVHVQNNWQLALIVYVKYILLKSSKLKIIYTLHGFRHNNPVKARIAQLVIGTALLLFADKIICMSTYLVKKFCLLKYKIALIPLGVNEEYFFKEQPAIPSNGLQMVFPAQFRFGKNQDLIIRAFAEHIKKTGDMQSHLIFPGTGPLEDKLKELVKSLNLSDRVTFPGFCSKDVVKDLYLRSNIGIVASNCETFGQSIVEPFVLGRCVISTHVGIAEDILINGENGFFFSNQKELEDVFSQLYNNQNLISKLGSKNYKNRNMFSWNTVKSKYEQMIANIK